MLFSLLLTHLLVEMLMSMWMTNGEVEEKKGREGGTEVIHHLDNQLINNRVDWKITLQ